MQCQPFEWLENVDSTTCDPAARKFTPRTAAATLPPELTRNGHLARNSRRLTQRQKVRPWHTSTRDGGSLALCRLSRGRNTSTRTVINHPVSVAGTLYIWSPSSCKQKKLMSKAQVRPFLELAIFAKRRRSSKAGAYRRSSMTPDRPEHHGKLTDPIDHTTDGQKRPQQGSSGARLGKDSPSSPRWVHAKSRHFRNSRRNSALDQDRRPVRFIDP